jgi:putative colanic acid biosynthesis acetyltransferase WcaF
MPRLSYKSKNQKNPYTSSWSLKEVIGIRIWHVVWLLLFRTSPKLMGRYWRVFLLKIFGATLTWDVFVYASAKIYVPWLLKMESKACLGPHSEVYNLGVVHLAEKVTISQYAYICNGTHDFNDEHSPLMIGDIYIAKNVFVGAKAFIMPGIHIREGAIIGACSVVTRDVNEFDIVGGNPAKFIKKRINNNNNGR